MIRVSGDWLTAAPTRAVLEILENAGYKALFVGGCVRDALARRAVNDIDLATDAHPRRVMTLASTAGLDAVPTGIEHGTVTVVSAGMPHEVTTFRRDVETDGRRAVVAFSDRLEDDAQRRDFTMNALYAAGDGAVIDPTGTGMSDLASGIVRFVGEPEERIREDYLRILRFFRFQAWFGKSEAGFDPEALAAISKEIAGIDTVSNERTGHEVQRLLDAPDPVRAVASMEACGVLARILPGAGIRALGPLVHLETEADIPPDWRRRLATLGRADAAGRLRLSRADARHLESIMDAAAGAAPPTELGYRLGEGQARDAVLVRAASMEQPIPDDMFEAVRKGAMATFPVSAEDLMPNLSGPALGRRLRALEDRWIASGFALSRDGLLKD
jgi:poly(A) polymerase